MIEQNITNSYTEIYVGGGNFLTQRRPTNFHTFMTRMILSASDSIDNYREVTAAERTKLEDADAAFVRPPQSLIDAYNAAMTLFTGSESSRQRIGNYDEETGLFNYDNKLSFTYEEVLMAFSHRIPHITSGDKTTLKNIWFLTLALPLNIEHGGSIAGMFAMCRNLKICSLTGYYSNITVSSIASAFNSCYELEYIVGKPLNLVYVKSTVDAFKGCYKLKEVWIQNLKTSISFSDSPNLALECFEYIIANASNSSYIAITVHPDVYAKLTDTANTEWNKVLTDAAAKNIQFITV